MRKLPVICWVSAVCLTLLIPQIGISMNAHIALEAARVGDRAEIRWKTNAGDDFIIQRSLDGYNWIDVIMIYGGSDTNQVIEFFDIDIAPPSSQVFYRIERLAEDGELVYSPVTKIPALEDILKLEETMDLKTISQPLKVNSKISLPLHTEYHKPIILVLRGVKGQEYYLKATYQQDIQQFVIEDLKCELPAGSYVVTATSNDNFQSLRLGNG